MGEVKFELRFEDGGQAKKKRMNIHKDPKIGIEGAGKQPVRQKHR